MHPAARHAYLANINDNTLRVLDLVTMATVDVMGGFDSPYGVVTDDTSNLREIARVSSGGAPTIMSSGGAEG